VNDEVSTNMLLVLERTKMTFPDVHRELFRFVGAAPAHFAALFIDSFWCELNELVSATLDEAPIMCQLGSTFWYFLNAVLMNGKLPLTNSHRRMILGSRLYLFFGGRQHRKAFQTTRCYELGPCTVSGLQSIDSSAAPEKEPEYDTHHMAPNL
jgi:hypothetical protein